jgi:NADH:ubiquinone oxidoreductase subunit 5 (subunit L)/multisubunit Na+/H+ antiporter MnhA subunit
MGLYVLAFFHLLTHALFKASLFLCAGKVIHTFRGRQDIRFLRIVSSSMPLTIRCLSICSLSLGGFPFLSAFYSKDKIIEEAFARGYNVICLFFLMISVLLTIIYSFRLLFYSCMENYTFRLRSRQDRDLIVKPILVLTVGGVVGGRLLRWLILDLFYDNLFIGLKILILRFCFLGGFLGLTVNKLKIKFISFYLASIWFLPDISRKFFIQLNFFYRKSVFKY